MLPKVAVVGPFYNADHHVDAWFAALSRQTYSNLVILAVDDKSTDGTYSMLKRACDKCPFPTQLIGHPVNLGPSAARNSAIRTAITAGADIVLFLDADCRVSPDWVKRHADFHHARPQTAILGGAIQGVAESYFGISDGFASWFTAVPYSRSGKVTKMHLSTTNMSIKTSVFGKIGFLDEDLATGEDVAYCRRVQKAGLEIWFQSDLVVQHLDRNRFSEAKRHHYRWGLHSFTLSARKHGGYFEILSYLKPAWLAAALVPFIALATTLLSVLKFWKKDPSVIAYAPGILALKWVNAVGVYRGFRHPELCLLKRLPPPAPVQSERPAARPGVTSGSDLSV